MNNYLIFCFCCALTIGDARPETGTSPNNAANKPQPGPKRSLPLWTSGKLLTLFIVLSIVIGGLLFCCCFQFSCSVTVRNFTEENATLLHNKASEANMKYQSVTQLERWE